MTTLPHERIDDLDSWEREDDGTRPYRFRHGGEVFTTNDPRDVDWREIQTSYALALNRGIAGPFLALMIQDVTRFEQIKCSQARLGELLRRIAVHYGFGSPPESPASST